MCVFVCKRESVILRENFELTGITLHSFRFSYRMRTSLFPKEKALIFLQGKNPNDNTSDIRKEILSE